MSLDRGFVSWPVTRIGYDGIDEVYERADRIAEAAGAEVSTTVLHVPILDEGEGPMVVINYLIEYA